jgi:NAD(P)-dependent dehydrogenase (short-subunit alcohol dehydrogenase family)
MTEKNVWLITGAGRGLGVDIAKAALGAGHAVVATGRDAAKVAAAVGNHESLLAIKLDVTRPQDAQSAVDAAVAKFARIDVLVNNAGNFFAGFFEELSPEQVRNQLDTLLFGPMNVTRAALPVMRKQRSGLLLTISSTAGIAGQMFCTAYAAAKFGIEGWMESLAPEIAPFGIRTMLVEPGFFRTELLTNDSTTYAQPTIDDYAERTKEIAAAWKRMDGKQGGDPAKLADALVKLAALKEPGPASLPALTPCIRSRPRPTRCSHKPKPTASCPRPSRTTTPDESNAAACWTLDGYAPLATRVLEVAA